MQPTQKTAAEPSSSQRVDMFTGLSAKRIKSLLSIGAACGVLVSCSVTAVRPSQEMSNMEVAIRAAKEVGADNLSPELYRSSVELGIEARKEYRIKNFQKARELAETARVYAERAEFESIQNGGQREAIPMDPLVETGSNQSPK